MLLLVDAKCRVQLAHHSLDPDFSFVEQEQRNIENAIRIGYGCTELQYEVARLARRTQTKRVWVLPIGALAELWNEHAKRYTQEDYLTQLLGLVKVWHTMARDGRVMVWPQLPKVIPGKEATQRALDVALPPHHSFALCLWDEGKLATGVAIARNGKNITHIVGVEKILEWSGPLSREISRDQRFIERGIEQHLPPLHMGIFAEYNKFNSLIRSNEHGAWTHGAWTKAITLREVIIHPAPPYVGVAMGADIARAIATKSKEFFYGVDALKPLAMLSSQFRSQIRRIASVNQTLGFDPLQTLAEFLDDGS